MTAFGQALFEIDDPLASYVVNDKGLRQANRLILEGTTNGIINIHLPDTQNEYIYCAQEKYESIPLPLLKVHHGLGDKTTVSCAGTSPNTSGISVFPTQVGGIHGPMIVAFRFLIS